MRFDLIIRGRVARTAVITALCALLVATSTAIAGASGGELRLPAGAPRPKLCTCPAEAFTDLGGTREVEISLEGKKKKTVAATRVDLIVHANGTFQMGRKAGPKEVKSETELAGQLRAALFHARRLNYVEDDGCSVIDLVIYAAPDVPFMRLAKVMQVAGEERLKIYRIHFAVRDPDSGKEGVVTYYLPRQVALVNAEAAPPDGRYEVFFCGLGDGTPLYEIKAIQGPRGPVRKKDKAAAAASGKQFNTLEEFLKAFDACRKKHAGAHFYFTLGGVPIDLEPSERDRIRTQDFVDLLAGLTVRGVDTKMTAPVYVEEIIEEIEELPPEDE